MERPVDRTLPNDAIEVMIISNWSVFYSASKERIYVYPADYHPGTLEISKTELMNLLQIVNKSGT